MALNFKILCHQGSDGLQLKLMGDFDGSSAYELINTLEAHRHLLPMALIAAVNVVDSLDEALDHIEKYGSGHSEAIVSNDYMAAMRFLDEVDTAAVYVNASTRFTDGAQFGLGAEVGISTQKLHARGPMGLKELTAYKWTIMGTGQVRP